MFNFFVVFARNERKQVCRSNETNLVDSLFRGVHAQTKALSAMNSNIGYQIYSLLILFKADHLNVKGFFPHTGITIHCVKSTF